jgi:N-acetyl-anhydromuramyl-L-alanine amidase AmpD
MVVKLLKTWLASRARKRPPTTVVLHATAGDKALGSINYLRQIGLSYHYLIEDDGSVFKCVPASRIAFHAGVSDGPDGGNVNDYSIGIAFANRNDGIEGYTKEAIVACRELVAELKAQYPSIKWLTTHYAITVTADGKYRKSDPVNFAHMKEISGGLFLWKPVYAKTFALFI